MRLRAALGLLAAGLLVAGVGLGCAAIRRDQGFTPPRGWPAPRYVPIGGAAGDARFALGRRLFYEPLLSRDGSISCGSCHQQHAGFANAGHAVSHGIGNALGERNAPALGVLAWQPSFMWDGAVQHLELQPVTAISHPREMGEDLGHVVRKLREQPEYPALFRAAFGTPGIDGQRVLQALAQFTAQLVPADTAYDRDALDAEQRRGLALFRARCAGCHTEPLFTDFSFRNNGLDATPKDAGRAHISERQEDFGTFRVPGLRNVAVSPPYMHDGRYATLDEVIAHYADGIEDSATLDAQLRARMPLDETQRQALRRFLEALTDERFLRDPRFAEPQRPRATPAPPRNGFAAAGIEGVIWREGADWRLSLDDARSNAPLAAVSVVAEQAGETRMAELLAPGLFRLPATAFSAGLPLDLRIDDGQHVTTAQLRLPFADSTNSALARQ